MKFYRTSDFIVVFGFVAIAILVSLGYIFNVIRLCHCDFASPYKAEVIRGAGVVCPPVGIILGYCRIDDN